MKIVLLCQQHKLLFLSSYYSSLCLLHHCIHCPHFQHLLSLLFTTPNPSIQRATANHTLFDFLWDTENLLDGWMKDWWGVTVSSHYVSLNSWQILQSLNHGIVNCLRCSSSFPFCDFKPPFLNQIIDERYYVWFKYDLIRTEVPRTSSSARLGLELMTSRS